MIKSDGCAASKATERPSPGERQAVCVGVLLDADLLVSLDDALAAELITTLKLYRSQGGCASSQLDHSLKIRQNCYKKEYKNRQM